MTQTMMAREIAEIINSFAHPMQNVKVQKSVKKAEVKNDAGEVVEVDGPVSARGASNAASAPLFSRAALLSLTPPSIQFWW